MAGLDVYVSSYRILEKVYTQRFAAPEALISTVNDGNLGLRSGHGFLDIDPKPSSPPDLPGQRLRAPCAAPHGTRSGTRAVTPYVELLLAFSAPGKSPERLTCASKSSATAVPLGIAAGRLTTFQALNHAVDQDDRTVLSPDTERH